MERIRGWLLTIFRLTWYLLYRMGVARQPVLMDVRHEIMLVFVDFFRWNRRMRVIGGERCPRDLPIVFAANHIGLIDPFALFRAAYLASGVYARFMSRDDFFAGMKSRFFKSFLNVDELMILCGTLQISRENVSLSQLKPFVQLLRNGESFIMFPGRTRSRSGAIVEYRDQFQEPGGVSFFVAHAQSGPSGRPAAAVPMTRTLNPATKRMAIAMGEALRLEPGADRAAQRAFDGEIILRMAEMVEVNAAHVVAGLLYLRCLHGLPARVSVAALRDDAADAIGRLRTPYVDPAARDALDAEIRRTLRYLAKHGMLTRRRGEIEANVEAVLSAPPLDRSYRRVNPVKYLVNQVFHLPDVVSALEEVVLARR